MNVSVRDLSVLSRWRFDVAIFSFIKQNLDTDSPFLVE